MDPVFAWIESTAFSIWMREDLSMFAFPGVLAVHTVGLALVVGFNIVLDLRLLGVGRDVPLIELRRFLPVMWLGFALNAASGVALLVAYPTKALTDPVFYVKLAFIAAAVWILVIIRRSVLEPWSPRRRTSRQLAMLAGASLVCWAGAITAGRLLAYTFRRLTVDF
jgi:hypothetical protein